MKKLIPLAATMIVATMSAYGQNSTKNKNNELQTPVAATLGNDSIYSYVEHMPEPNFNLSKYLSESISYPEKARIDNLEGKVVLKFVVNKKGKVGNVTIKKSASPELDAEAIRVVREMPDWKPAKLHGKPVDVYYTLPIKFTLTDEVKTK